MLLSESILNLHKIDCLQDLSQNYETSLNLSTFVLHLVVLDMW